MSTEASSTTTQPRNAAAMTTVAPTGCCPPFDPASFHEMEVIWENKPFVSSRASMKVRSATPLGGQPT